MIYITGDTHGSFERFINKTFKKDDSVIILGDCALIWSNVITEIEINNINFLNSLNATIYFIDGNHENFERLNKFPITNNMHKISKNIFHLIRGNIYTIENKTFFAFGGALSQDKIFRRLNISYWNEEIPSKKEMDLGIDNLNKVNNKVDYIITHTIYDSLSNVLVGKFSNDPTTNYLTEIKNKVDYFYWYFGHYHIDQKFNNTIALYEEIILL